MQQGLVDKSSAADGEAGNAGKRGLHSAAGAFWDVNRDGMWTFKYPGGEEKGLDVVVSVTWFAVGLFLLLIFGVFFGWISFFLFSIFFLV